MEEREELLRDLERYRRLLRFSTDEHAVAAIEQLISEIRNRLDRLGTGDITPC